MIIGCVLFFLNRENSKGKELKEMLHFLYDRHRITKKEYTDE